MPLFQMNRKIPMIDAFIWAVWGFGAACAVLGVLKLFEKRTKNPTFSEAIEMGGKITKITIRSDD
jgi:hypothetical protein